MTLKELINAERAAVREAFSLLSIHGSNKVQTQEAELKMLQACDRTDAAIRQIDPQYQLQLHKHELDLIYEGLSELGKQCSSKRDDASDVWARIQKQASQQDYIRRTR